MKIINLFLGLLRKNFHYVLLFLLCLLIYFPSFRLKFSLLDDGLTIKNARIIATSIKSLDVSRIGEIIFEPQHGRVRPAYWIGQSVIAWLSLYNSAVFHILRFILLLIAIFVMGKILKKIGVSKLWILAALFIFVFNFQNAENYLRLGPTEPFLALYYVLTLYLVFFAKTQKASIIQLLSIFLLSFLGVFTKESYFLVGMALVPTLALLRIYRKRSKAVFRKVLFTAALVLILGFIIFLIKKDYPPIAGYAAQYQFSIGQIVNSLTGFKANLFFYQPVILLLAPAYLLVFLYNILKRRFKNISYDEIFYLTIWFQLIFQLLVLLPWPYVLNRYLLLVNVNLTIVYGITFFKLARLGFDAIRQKWANLNLSETLYSTVIFWVLLIPFAARNILPIANYQLWLKTDSVISNSSIKALADVVPREETIFVNYKKGDANIEIFLEAGWHLEEFYNRKDIKFVYLDETNFCANESRYIFDRTSDRLIDPREFVNSSNYEVIANGNFSYESLNYSAVVRSFFYRVKAENWSEKYLFDWAIYVQRPKTCIDKGNLL